jgi:hypothetical protein
MEVLYQEQYFFIVSRNEETDEHYLEVLCGTSATYTIRIKMTEKEIADFRHNRTSVQTLAGNISYSPSKFLDRRV